VMITKVFLNHYNKHHLKLKIEMRIFYPLPQF